MNAKSQNNPDLRPDTSTPSAQRNISIESEALPEHIIKNVEKIDKYQTQYQQKSKPHHRLLDRLGAIFCQPQYLYGQVVFFTFWIVCSNLAARNIITKNFPRFDPSFHALDIASLLATSGVLVYQTRQGKLSEDRSHLMLQLNLVTEQKIAKLISLMEELRVDLPNVKNRHDIEAEVMQQASDPQAILEVIQQIAEQSPDSEPETKIVSN
ncbi:DUF1003 domain-containing protein [Chamaesiphon sp.]|uniref:DUF1003 domain-containing protein n=1 Tax=Chamaesiphon sp. TaxID=2814140 RepID=UPI0035941585